MGVPFLENSEYVKTMQRYSVYICKTKLDLDSRHCKQIFPPGSMSHLGPIAGCTGWALHNHLLHPTSKYSQSPMYE